MREASTALRGAVKFLTTRPGEALLAGRMAASVAALSLLLRVLPLPRALALVSGTRRLSGGQTAGVSEERLVELLDAVLGLRVLCFRPVCWKRAAVLNRFLALRGRETRIRFGVRREGDDVLAGHAWLEDGGVPVFEAAPPEYTVTYSFPS
jgi:hypothetical protein